MQRPIPISKARAAALSYISSNADPWKASAGSLVLELQHAAGLSAGFRFAAQSNRFAERKPGGALR